MSNYNLYYRNQSTKELIVEEVARGAVMDAARNVLSSLTCDRRFGIYLVREEEAFIILFNGPRLYTLRIRRQDLPDEVRMYLLLLGE